MSFKMFLEERKKYDYVWDDETTSYTVTIDGLKTDFTYQAKSKWDRSAAELAAKRHIGQLKKLEYDQENAKRDAELQAKPLSTGELRWLELHKKLIHHIKTKTVMPEKELNLYKDLGPVLRRSLLDGSHPAMKDL
jgi:hypothetical protein